MIAHISRICYDEIGSIDGELIATFNLEKDEEVKKVENKTKKEKGFVVEKVLTDFENKIISDLGGGYSIAIIVVDYDALIFQIRIRSSNMKSKPTLERAEQTLIDVFNAKRFDKIDKEKGTFKQLKTKEKLEAVYQKIKADLEEEK